MKILSPTTMVLFFFSIVSTQFQNIPPGETIIIFSAPSVNDPYYGSVFNQIIEYQAQFANSAGPGDHAFIVVDAATIPYFDGLVAPEKLIQGTINDIWIRDFGSVRLTEGNYDFDYAPNYLDQWTANWIESSFTNWQNGSGFEAQVNNLVLDGGNFVYDGIGRAILTARIFSDNPAMSHQEVRTSLLSLNGLNEIAIIPEEPGDVTGHSDGMVFWLDTETIAVNIYDEPFRSAIHDSLYSAFSGVGIIEIPYVPDYNIWNGWPSANGVYVNALGTRNNNYIPTFGLNTDSEAIALFDQYSEKQIIPIDASGVAMMGGSVHCMTWEVFLPVQGDLNYDGTLNVTDIVLLVQFILGVTSPTDQQFSFGDLNIDGNLDVQDIVLLVGMILG